MTSQEFLTHNLITGSDISGHLAVMCEYAQQCSRIVEFGVRGGNSTSAWLHARPSRLWCYDKSVPENLAVFQDIAKQNDIQFTFTQADTRTVTIPETDLLFLDTLHNSEQLAIELKQAGRVYKFIILHDTDTNGWSGENWGGGLKHALIEFLLANSQWRIDAHHSHNNGLTILRRV